MGRFEREAQVLASLNHPNIAAIYGLGGERRAARAGDGARLGRGARDPDRARQDPARGGAAHRARDRRGARGGARQGHHPSRSQARQHQAGLERRQRQRRSQVKILDFGLAKALQGDLASSSSGIDLTRSPTLSVAATQAGMILGTAGYMSPEQARALSADRRADIWSFGVILYEMMAGRRAFTGDTVADTLAKVIEREPGLVAAAGDDAARDQEPDRALPGQEPAPAAAGDRRRAAGARGDAGESGAAAVGGSSSAPRSREAVASQDARAAAARSRAVVPWAIAAAALAVAGYFAFGGLRRGERAPRRCRRCRSRSRWEAPSSTSGWARASRFDGRHAPGLRRGRRRRSASSSCDSSIGSSRRCSTAATAVRPRPIIRSSRRTASGSASSPPTELRKMQFTGGTPMKICARLAQPRRHLAARRHHRVRSRPRQRPVPGVRRRAASPSRSPSSTPPRARGRIAGRRRFPTASTSSSPSHTLQSGFDVRHRSRWSRSKPGSARSSTAAAATRATSRPATWCSSTAARCSRRRSTWASSSSPRARFPCCRRSPCRSARAALSSTSRTTACSPTSAAARRSTTIPSSGSTARAGPASSCPKPASTPTPSSRPTADASRSPSARRQLGRLGVRPRARRLDAAHLRQVDRERADLVARTGSG